MAFKYQNEQIRTITMRYVKGPCPLTISKQTLELENSSVLFMNAARNANWPSMALDFMTITYYIIIVITCLNERTNEFVLLNSNPFVSIQCIRLWYWRCSSFHLFTNNEFPHWFLSSDFNKSDKTHDSLHKITGWCVL